ncbi:hypothetical protein C6496_01775 [Candidatus Poribacteria bacterium]|nr:MAG: hypothetical protein C6496_01775 [Candidatus Poribacteria bacterium]
MKWLNVVKTSEIEPGQSIAIKLDNKIIAIFNTGKKFYAINNACPHLGGPLNEGTLEGEVVTCPWHGWQYDLKSGCPITTPNVRTYPLRLDGDTLQIAVTPEAPMRDRLEDTVFNQTVEADHIYGILEQIQLGKTLDEVFENIYAGLQHIVPHNRLGIALIDESSGDLVQCKTKSNKKILLDNGFSAKIEGSSLEPILNSGEARIIDDFKEILAKRPTSWTGLMVQEGMRSNLTLPLKVQGKPIGVVFFTSEKPRAFSETHIRRLKPIAGQLSILIEKGNWTDKLAENNRRYRTLFEMSNDAIFISPSLTEAFVTVNENFCTWLGYTHQELVNLSLRDLMPPNEFQNTRETLKGLDQQNPITFQTELSRKNKNRLPVEIRAIRIVHNEREFIQGFARDLSEVKALNAQLKEHHSFGNLIGKNRKMREIFELIQLVAPMKTTVLIQGESGTGKEPIAHAIHDNSERAKQPFVRVNCAGLVDNLLESELFGHVKGAFTDAIATRQGRFAAADGGTLFLDEIGELSLGTQAKLLRVLQEGEYEMVGSTETKKVDVRVIAATNRVLKTEIEAGRFRKDLYYRLNVVPITPPPLRERRDDLPRLIEHFIEKFSQQTQKSIYHISPDALEILMDYTYPGNVRELENIIEHAFVKCQDGSIEKQHLPLDLISSRDDIVTQALRESNPLAALERELVQRVLEESDGKPQLAAQRLGISRTTLWRKLKAV